MAMKRVCLLNAFKSRVAITGARTLVGKALRIKKDKPAPFPYLEKDYWHFQALWDKTTLRLDENSKLIVVEGAHGVGKSKLAKELADEFEMMYMGPPEMDDIYISPYGVDFRKFNSYYPDWYKTFDEKDFIRNPLGVAHGAVDRYLFRNYYLKFRNQIRAIRHILNTGQGVVMEGCAQTDYIYFEAAYHAGWVQPETREVYFKSLELSLDQVLRPNLIVYLDAPIDVVQKNKAASGNEWDKNSPVWANKQYLNAIYSEFKKNYLKDIQQYARVLVYDWSEPGDSEVVIEDIEHLEMDLIEAYDDQQCDWRFHNEEKASFLRYEFTNKKKLVKKLRSIYPDMIHTCTTLSPTADDCLAMNDVIRQIPSEVYEKGANAHMGDKTFVQLLFGATRAANYREHADFKVNQFFIPSGSKSWYEKPAEGLV